MQKRSLRIAIFILGCFFTYACSPIPRTLKSSTYTELDAIEQLHLLVVGSKETSDSFRYLKQYMSDSLSNNFTVTSAYTCCIGPKISVSEVLQQAGQAGAPPQATTHVLLIVPKKHIVGYGTSSTIEYRMGLFNLRKNEMEWEYEMALTFSWFIDDAHYRNVALASSTNMMREMRRKGVVR